MSDVRSRLNFWRKLGQAAAPSTAFDLRSIPQFKPNLFSARPDIIPHLNQIASIFNKYLVSLSGGKVTFALTWTNPSIDQSEFTNSLKTIYGLAKWMTGIVISNALAPYSVPSLAKIANDLNTRIQQYDFPEPSVSNIKAEVVSACQNISNILGRE